MNLTEWMFWLICLGVIAVNGALVYVAWWALFADQARGRRRCPRCWYDLAYSPGMRCAECGYTAKRESQLFSTRRRYKIAAAAILVSVCIALAISERASQRGLVSLLPTRALVWLVPFSDNSQQSVFGELLNREMLGRLSESQRLALLRRCAKGDWWARPPDDAWVNKYGNYILSVRPNLVGSDTLEEPLLQIPPRLEARTRSVWPVNVPVIVSLHLRDWWPTGTECRVTAKPRLDGVEPTVILRGTDARYTRTPYALELPPLNPQARQIEIDVQIERRRPRAARDQQNSESLSQTDHDQPWEHVSTQRLTVTTRAEGEIDQHLSPVRDSQLDEALALVFRTGVVQWAEGQSRVRFNIDVQQTFVPALNDTAMGLIVELKHAGTVARRLHVWWTAGDNITTPPLLLGQWPPANNRGYGFAVDFEDPELLQQLSPETADQWQIHLISDRQLALRSGDLKKYWEGELVLPVRVQLRSDPAPPRPWRNP